MVRSMGRAARLLNAQLRHCVSSIQGEQLSDVASSSMNGSDSSDENLPTDPSSDSDDSTSDHSASSYESVDLSDDTAGYTDHTGGPPHPTPPPDAEPLSPGVQDFDDMTPSEDSDSSAARPLPFPTSRKRPHRHTQRPTHTSAGHSAEALATSGRHGY